jgi:hypothetical protein
MYTEKILKLLIASKQMSVSLSRHKYPEVPFHCKFTAVNVSGHQDYYTGQLKTLVPGFLSWESESLFLVLATVPSLLWDELMEMTLKNCLW